MSSPGWPAAASSPSTTGPRLCALFRAKELDRSICDPAIAQALIEHAPPDGYPPVSAGVLDAGTVWRAVSRHVFDMGESEPDLVSLLLWATTRSGPARYLAAPPELRDSLRQRLVAGLGDAADSILRFIESGAGADALALAVACQVVFGEGTGHDARSRRRPDGAVPRQQADPHGDRAAPGPCRRRCRRRSGPPGRRPGRPAPPPAGRRAAPAVPLRGPRLPQPPDPARLRAAAGPVRGAGRGGHRRPERGGDPASASSSRPRSPTTGSPSSGGSGSRSPGPRWPCGSSAGSPAPRRLRRSFAEFADAYRKELAFVDWARESICRGDEVAGLSKAYQQLDRAVLARREEFNRAFAVSLADWTSVGSDARGVCGVEDVLAQVVAKVAGPENRVLLIVLDGMSWAVCHELLDDIRHEHWFEATLDESSAPPRARHRRDPERDELLPGEPAVGEADERRCGGREAELRGRTRVLKAVLRPEASPGALPQEGGHRGGTGGGGRRAEPGRSSPPNNRVVGVVINAIDDRLRQVRSRCRDDWTINRIGPLGVAAEAGP